MFNPNDITPQKNIQITPEITLECADLDKAEKIFPIVDGNRAYLRKWLTWVDESQNIQDARDFMEFCMQNSKNGTTFAYGIRVRDFFVGVFEIHWHNNHNHDVDNTAYAHLEFWLGEQWQGNGIMTHVIRGATAHIFSVYGVDCVGISCASQNDKARQVAKNAGYTAKKTIPLSETLLNGDIVDHTLYCQFAPNVDIF